MSFEQLQSEIDTGVSFVGHQEHGELIGVMGSQDVQDVTLIRHAYVLPEHQRHGIGHALLAPFSRGPPGRSSSARGLARLGLVLVFLYQSESDKVT